jgi:RNA polymerase sigma factor (sigma-70 family)
MNRDEDITQPGDRDSDLLARVRTGDQRAYAELWARYSQVARAVARTYWWSADSDDLVAESFTRIYQAIQTGKGPTTAFKPYLFATMRNLAISWGRSRREVPIEYIEAVEDPASTDQAADSDFDAALVSKAILTLPTRWQDVLWLAEVEDLSMLEIGRRLEISERAAAVLAFRAREGLRQAWISAHLTSRPPASKECRWTLSKLGAHARRRLTTRDDRRVRAHLAMCADCSAKAEEARRASSRILTVLFPAGIGVGTGLQLWQTLTTSGVSASASSMPATITLPAVGLVATKTSILMTAAVAVVTLSAGITSTVTSDVETVETSAAAERLDVVESDRLPTLLPTAIPSEASPPPPPQDVPVPVPETSTPAQAPQPPPAAPAPPVAQTPGPPVILSIPSQVSRTQVVSASIRCEAGADVTVSAFGVTAAVGTCSSSGTWQASVDVGSYPVAAGTVITFDFVQSNIAGVSGSASAQVTILD